MNPQQKHDWFQEPVLFSSAIRENLDPFRKFSDDQIWEALEQVNKITAKFLQRFKPS